MSEHEQQILALTDELHRLKRKTRQYPSPQACSRMAEVAGILAAYREEAAWIETRRILETLGRPD